MKTIINGQITAADCPYKLAAGNADGSLTVYYEGDEIPSMPEPSTPAVTLTAQQFRDRFTRNELLAMLASEDVNVKLLVLQVQTADPFSMNNATVQAGLDYLVSQEVITLKRRQEIGSLT